MKKNISLWMLPLLFWWPQQAVAQQPLSLPADSITIDTLLESMEKNTSYRIYTTIDTSFKVLVRGKTTPLQQLKEALAPTPYKLSVYGNILFVLKEQELITLLPPTLTGEPEKDEGYYGDVYTYLRDEPEKASSENKVYNVGDVRIKQRPRKATLKGQVTNFKTGEPMIGINLILKDPWIATTTDAKGNMTHELPTGHKQMDIKGLNVKDTRRQIMLFSDGTLNIELEESAHMLDEVTITSGRIQNVKSTQLGAETLRPTQLKNIPMALGEVDILKMVQALPGVKTVGEASSGFNVRS